MSHLDDDTIASAGMGDALDAIAIAHLEACAECADVVSKTRDLAEQAGSIPRPGPLLVPPARVWDAIVAELESDDTGAGEDAPQSAPAEPTLATVTPLRRRRTAVWLASAAAAGVVIGAVGVALWPSAPAATVLAATELSDLATEAPAGEARLEQRDDGVDILVVDTTYTQVADADLEVWLIDPEIEGMVSLGYLTSDHGEFVVPAGYDIVGFPIVDVSVEPRDGKPTHSGASVTRGVFGA